MTQVAMKGKYYVDVVMCIDGTLSMYNIIDNVKQKAKAFYEIYSEAMINSGRMIEGFRVRVIVFRDYACDGADSMVCSDFFDMLDPVQQEEFNEYVNNIEAIGGGDIAENALEALALALQSKWNVRGGSMRRLAVLLFTDAPAHPLQKDTCREAPNYPANMPADIGELNDIYTFGDQELAPYYVPKFGRLLVYAPESASETWKAIKSWDRAWVIPTKPDGGCSEIDVGEALNVLVNTF